MAEKINDGGPAFPVHPDVRATEPHAGMTLRDYFAAKALACMMGVGGMRQTATFAHPEGRATAAKVCYMMADAMLEARKS